MGALDHEADHLFSRRALLRGAAGVGVAAVAGTLLPACSSRSERESSASGTKGEPPPEITTIRLHSIPPVACIAAEAMAEPFLREEGFTDIQYRPFPAGDYGDSLSAGDIDFVVGFAPVFMMQADAGRPTVMLGGIHVGCWQVFGTGEIKTMRDFKGKTVAIRSPTASDGIFMAMTLANVGLDLRKDVKLVTHAPAEDVQILSSGEVDAVIAFPPISQELRAKEIGTVVLNSMTDRPWSDYFCCVAAVNRNWMDKHPVATKRALRAVLKGADVVAREPERAARAMVDLRFTDNYDFAVESLREIPYDVWRGFDPLDSMRFYALRLKEAGLIKSTPEEIIKRGTDFHYLAELKKELKEA